MARAVAKVFKQRGEETFAMPSTFVIAWDSSFPPLTEDQKNTISRTHALGRDELLPMVNAVGATSAVNYTALYPSPTFPLLEQYAMSPLST